MSKKRVLAASLMLLQLGLTGGPAAYASTFGMGNMGTISSVISANQVVPTNYVRPETYGAKRDGLTDDQAAIKQAFTVAKQKGGTVYFSYGTYACGSQVIDDSVPVFADLGSDLNFTNASNGGLVLTGNNPSLMGLTITFTNPTKNTNVAGLLINKAKNFSLNTVFVKACPGDNVDCISSGPGTIKMCVFSQSLATSLMMRNCLGVTVDTNRMDNFAVLQGIGPSRALQITNNGIGTDHSNNSYIPKLAGIAQSYFTGNTVLRGALNIGASKMPPFNPGYADGNVSALYVGNNTIDGGSAVPDPNVTMGIIVNPLSTSTSTQVRLERNTVQNLQGNSAIYVGPQAKTVYVLSNNVNNIYGPSGGTPSFGILTDSTSNLDIENNRLSRISSTAIQCNPTEGSGVVYIAKNAIDTVCFALNPPKDLPILAVKAKSPTATISSLTITGNTYSGDANSATSFIECLVPSSATKRTISGNTQSGTTLPNNIVP